MTVIAWDGKTLAADKRADVGGTALTTTKIKKLESGEIVAFTGSVSTGRILLDWYENGAEPEEWPESQNGDDWARLIVASKGGVCFYEGHPVAVHCEDKFAAFGSGRDVALGALAMGADAIKAVEIASMFQSDCGNGCDYHEV